MSSWRKMPFAAVFGGRHPRRPAVAGELDEAADEVVDAVHLVEAGEPEDCVDLLHLVDRDDTTDSLVQFRSALHLGDHEAAGVLLLREQRRLLEVPPLRDEQVDGIPGGELLLTLLFGVRGSEYVGHSRDDVVIGDAGHVDVLGRRQRANDVDLGAELLDLLDAEFDAEPVGERFLLLGIGAGHDDDRLGGGEPQVRGTHHDQRRAGVAFSIERIEMRVPAAALLRQLVATNTTLGFGHPPARTTGGTQDRRADRLADVRVTHLEVGQFGLRALAAAVNPQRVRELVEVPVGAGQEVLCRDGGAFALAAGRSRSLSSAAGAVLVCELREVGSEGVGVGVAEPRQRAEEVAAGAPEH